MRGRPATVLLATAVAALVLSAIPGYVQAAPQATRAASTRPAEAPRSSTVLTLRARHCNGCRIYLVQWLGVNRSPWISAQKTMHRGRVQYTMRTRHTHGLTIAVTGPWEADNTVPTGDQAGAVFRYAGQRPGSSIGFRRVVHKQRGSACWAGTQAHRVTLRLAVREVTVRATSGPDTQGTLAWLPRQRRSWLPMRAITDGVYRSEEATVCTPP